MKLLQKIIQISYMSIFLILGIGIAGNVDAGIETPMLIWVLEIITGCLTVGKVLYCSKGE